MKIFGLLFFLIFSLSLFAQNYSRKFTEGLNHETSQLSESDTVLVWVFFTDKGRSLNKYFEKPTLVVSKASLKRRAHVIKSGPLIDQTDLPVNRNVGVVSVGGGAAIQVTDILEQYGLILPEVSDETKAKINLLNK